MTAHLTRVKTRLRIHAHRKVRGLLEGEYASMHVGRSLDFNDLRAYVRGDDVKDIDWRATARTRQLLVKRYAAARKHTVLLAVSTGRSMAAANDLEVPKRDLAITVAGVFGYLAVKNGDMVSMISGDAHGHRHFRPRGTELHVERCLADIHDQTTAASGPSDLKALLRYVARHVRRRGILIIVSDEYGVDEELAGLLRRLAVQHEVLYASIGDLDPTGVTENRALIDVETAQQLPAWARDDAELHRQFAAKIAVEDTGMRKMLDSLGIAHTRVHDQPTAVRAILELMERHRHAKRR